MNLNKRREALQFVEMNSEVTQEVSMNPHTLVRVECMYNNQFLYAVGHAQCGPRDRFSKELGIAIATGRARMLIARKLMGLGKMVHGTFVLDKVLR